MNSEAAPPPRRHKLTRTDYHRMAEVGILAHDARVELIDGEIIDMPPIGPEPDLALLEPRADYYLREKPEPADELLRIEVSASSLAYDRDVKGPLYARHGIPVHWVLDLNERRLLLHEAPGTGQ